jgi:hypothetical protein
MYNPTELDRPRDKFVRYLYTLKAAYLLKLKGTAAFYKPFVTKEYPDGRILEIPRNKAKQQFYTLQLDDGILSSQRTARSVLGAEFSNAAAVLSIDDAFNAWKNSALVINSQNNVFLNRDSGLLRAQNFLSFFDSFSMAYDAPTFITQTNNSMTPHLVNNIFLKHIQQIKAEQKSNQWFHKRYFPHPLFISYFVRYVKSRLSPSLMLSKTDVDQYITLAAYPVKCLAMYRNDIHT